MRTLIACLVVLSVTCSSFAQDKIYSDNFEWGSICAWANLWYQDLDDDGWGDDTVARVPVSCPPPANLAPRGSDCDNGAATVNPGATEVCNSADDNCDFLTDEGCCEDLIFNGSETDLDCGGEHCVARGFTCAAELMCLFPRDCLDNHCVTDICVAGTCFDGILNQDEADVDCGGVCGATCSLGQTCSGDGDCTSASCYIGACSPSTYPRLLVAGIGGIKIWNNADDLVGDPSADTSLGGFSGNGVGLATAGNRLIAVSGDAGDSLHLYDGLAVISGASSPAAVIPSSAFGGGAVAVVYDAEVDPALNLWITTSEDGGTVRLFTDVPSMTSLSTSQARFTHPWSQIFGAVYDPSSPNEKLLAGQVSGAGVVAYDDPLGATGDSNLPDWDLHSTGVLDLLLANDSLYLADLATPRIAIWRTISAISSTQAPDVVMGAVGGLSGPYHLMRRADDTLVVTNNDAPSNFRVLLYVAASTITGDTPPDITVSHAEMVLPRKSYLAADDRLYVLMSGSVLIFANATTTPTMVAHIETAVTNARDMLILE